MDQEVLWKKWEDFYFSKRYTDIEELEDYINIAIYYKISDYSILY